MRYLIDTGVWLRLFDRTDSQHPAILGGIQAIRGAGHELVTCHQNIAEFWNVSTRPTTARGGYGQTVSKTANRVDFIERMSTLLTESPAAYAAWRQLVTTHNVEGVAVHDARLVATMQTAEVKHIVTLNTRDFTRYASVTALLPDDVLGSVSPDE